MKNTWQNSDTLTRWTMNQPFFLASGTVDGSGNVTVFYSTGSMRWAHKAGLTNTEGTTPVFGQIQSVTFGPTHPSWSYALYLRPDGSTILVSGHSGAPNSTLPDPPRWDAEPIGVISTGSPNDTTHLGGPWNHTGFGYEERGQYVAITAARPRLVYRQITTVGTVDGATATTTATASGIAYLSLADNSTGSWADATTKLQATISYLASGGITYATQHIGTATVPVQSCITPIFVIWRGEDSSPTGGCTVPVAFAYSTVQFSTSQTPDGSSPGSQIINTVSFHGIPTSQTATGYGLGVYMPPVAPYLSVSGTLPPAIRVQNVVFSALAGLQGSDTNEPT